MESPKNPQQQNESEIEGMIKDYQVVQAQMRNLAMQVDQYQAQRSEVDSAKTELDKAEGKIYVTIGGIMVETDKASAIKNVQEKIELLEIRLQASTKQYNELKAREKALREKLTAISKQEPK